MKYKLGKKYFYVDRGWIESVLFHSVTIVLDGGGIYSCEQYFDMKGTLIVEVNNRDPQVIVSKEIFATEKKAIDYQIRKLKECKKKNI